MMQLDAEEKERICRVAQQLHQAARPLKILETIAWPAQVKADFFAQNASQLPEVSYPDFDAQPVIEQIRAAKREIFEDNIIDLWLARNANAIEMAARMLAGAGTPVFFEYSRNAYGDPTSPVRFDTETPLELAQTIQHKIEQLNQIQLNLAPLTYYSAEEVAQQLEVAVKQHFGEDAPQVPIVDELSANALASSKSIKIRRDAQFTDRDTAQLLNHEAYIHVATAINGSAQAKLPILSVGHPGTTCTQEGLAVFSEIIAGTIELNRLQRLADRVFAIQMAIDGSNFLDVYHYFLERTDNPDQSFESARRVFRGGVITGGAPFTKDVVYLYGLLQVSGAIRAMFAAGRSDCLVLLFCGKLDLIDIPALCELTAMGLCQLPRYLPPWIQDPRYLLAFLTYSAFMEQIESEPMTRLVKRLLANAPVISLPSATATTATTATESCSEVIP
ncbi:MAG: flavohemoglobin expression-modulating QEGLA motif protein [Prochlorotrichaceae cyanobacterium]|jgi:uncharacterized protein (TIGR02421 family)